MAMLWRCKLKWAAIGQLCGSQVGGIATEHRLACAAKTGHEGGIILLLQVSWQALTKSPPKGDSWRTEMQC